METRTIGSLRVSVVGLGCNNFGMRLDQEESGAVVRAALDAGITLFDTADVYGGAKSEAYLGAALGSRRDEVVVATKFGGPYQGHEGGAGPAYVRRALEDSLRRLGTDHVDLYQLHTPDPKTPIADTLGALGELVAEGKVRELGCSNFTGRMLEEAAAAVADGAPRFVSVQNQYNLLHREPEDEVLAFCERTQTAFLPYFPLASGLLSGKYRAGEEAPQGTRLAAWGERESASSAMSDWPRWPPWTPWPTTRGTPSWISPSAGSSPTPPWPRSSPGRATRPRSTPTWPRADGGPAPGSWPRSTPSLRASPGVDAGSASGPAERARCR